MYDTYVSTGTYDQRYPSCNYHMLSALKRLVEPSASKVLDYGSGTGRYTLSLLDSTDANIVAYDVSLAALRQLKEVASTHPRCKNLSVVSGDPSEIDHFGPFDHILCLFGVLAHIPKRAARVEVLRHFHRILRRGTRSSLLISVPNASRRFRKLNRQFARLRAEGVIIEPASESGDILYKRTVGGDRVNFYYHLYTPRSFAAELAEAGFKVTVMFSESILPETVVTRSSVMRSLEHLFYACVPIRWAYGIAAIAEP